MPELPDLQIFSRNLHKQLSGKKLLRFRLLGKNRIKTPASRFKKKLEGSTLKKVHREGKEIHFDFSNGSVLGLHMMLHGKLYIFEESNPHKHTILELLFGDGTGLALTDYQAAARAMLDPGQKSAPDALSAKVSYGFLKEHLEGKRTAIKNLLLDQDVIRGIGNAYADEILWEARIAPLSVCNKIPDDRIRALAKAIPRVLKDAIKQIRKTNPSIIAGEVRDFLKIHNSKKKKSPTGSIIRKTTAGSRVTYYTAEQKLFR